MINRAALNGQNAYTHACKLTHLQWPDPLHPLVKHSQAAVWPVAVWHAGENQEVQARRVRG